MHGRDAELRLCGSTDVATERRAWDPDPFRQQTYLLFEQRKTAVDERIFHPTTIVRQCRNRSLRGPPWAPSPNLLCYKRLVDLACHVRRPVSVAVTTTLDIRSSSGE